MSSSDSKQKISTREKKSAARLAAVQALYQWEVSGQEYQDVLRQFLDDRRGHEVEDEVYLPFQKALFQALFLGVVFDGEKLNQMVQPYYQENLNEHHLGKLFHLSVQTACFEALHDTDLPVSVIIAEYVELVDALFHGDEAKVAHAMLDKILNKIRDL